MTKNMCALAALVALVALLASEHPPAGAAASPLMCSFRRRYGAVNDVDVCVYGFEWDRCGYYRCTKGPGDICGGKDNRYGICGEGLICNNCNVCTGCSLKTYECHPGFDCI